MIKLKSLNLLLKKTGSFHSKNLVFHIVNLEVFSFILKVFFNSIGISKKSLGREIYLYHEENKTPSRGKFIYITGEFRVFILYYI